ncbi:MAG TPA: hypothetical protein VN457_04585, partial [Chlamydiales bacterium]|nr:hypothetical protein [Chlamydiales bacterium]
MKAAKICGVVALVLVSSYSALWYYEADFLQKNLQAEIAKITQNNPLDLKLDYDSLQKSGFPFDICLTVVNPKIVSKAAASTQKPQPMELHFDGAVENKFSIFGELKSIETSGKVDFFLPKIATMDASHWVATGKIKLAGIYKKSLVDTVSDLFQKKIPDIDGLNLTCTRVEISKVTPEKESEGLSVDHAFVQYEKKKTSQLVRLRSDFSIQKSLVIQPPHNDSSFKECIQFVNNFLGKKLLKTNYSADFEIELPDFKTLQAITATPLMLLAKEIPAVSFHVSKFDSSGEYASSHTAGSLSLHEDTSKNVVAECSIESKAEYTPAFYNLLLGILGELKKHIGDLKSHEKMTEKFKALIGDHLHEVQAIIPKFQDFGPLHFKKSWSVAWNKG